MEFKICRSSKTNIIFLRQVCTYKMCCVIQKIYSASSKTISFKGINFNNNKKTTAPLSDLLYLRWVPTTYLLKMRSLSLPQPLVSAFGRQLCLSFFCFYAFSSSTRFKLGHQTLFYFTNFALIINKFLNDERTVKSI